MDLFNNDAASGSDNMADSSQGIQMNYAPELTPSQQAEYSDLREFDFTKYLEADMTAEELQNNPPLSVTESAFVDPRHGNLSNASLQPVDLSSTGIYNDMSLLSPDQSIYNAQNLLVDNAYQQNVDQPFQYQQGVYDQNTFQQWQEDIPQHKFLELKPSQQGSYPPYPIQPNPYQQSSYPLNPLQPNPYQQDNTQQIFTRRGLSLEAPQPVNPIQREFYQQELELFGDLDSMGEGQDYVYRNEILSLFDTPAIALQVIDRAEYPLHACLQTALEKAVANQENLKIVKAEPVMETKPKVGRKKHNNSSKISKKPAKKAGNNRALNRQITLAHANKVYRDIPTKPASWGSINPETGRLTFEYTKYGELATGQKYTVEQITEYLSQHPLHGKLPTGEPDTINSGLKLWIQYTAADSNNRYPEGERSNRCRFKSCPRKANTLLKGEPRICFDEQRYPPDFPKNPYHNAGYVHLYCIEKELNFPRLCRDFNVEVDVRKLNEPENRMSINKSTKTMEKVVNGWIYKNAQLPGAAAGRDSGDKWYETALHRVISEHHLATQTGQVQKTREARGGNTIDLYKGNLDHWAVADEALRAYKAAHPDEFPRKRKLDDVKKEEDEDEDAEGETDEDILERPIKRARRS